jgi:endonuclease/exonuclease/phosphatase family metal-dependent hydrolase
VFFSKNRHDTVGPRVEYSPEAPAIASDNPGRLLVVSWNVHVGHGNISSLVQELLKQERVLGHGRPDFVLLLQETFRRGEHVPDSGRARVPRRVRPPAKGVDIVDLARSLNWWLYYVPSMRNGRLTGKRAEDRGNAILSNLPITFREQIELPRGVHPRVAIMATIGGRRRPRFRVAVAHLDTRDSLRRGWVFGGPSLRNKQAKSIVAAIEKVSDADLPLILGGDLNTHLGGREASVKTVAAMMHRKRHGPEATHLSGLILDYMFARIPDDWEAGKCVRMASRFGSDHYPLVLPIDIGNGGK